MSALIEAFIWVNVFVICKEKKKNLSEQIVVDNFLEYPETPYKIFSLRIFEIKTDIVKLLVIKWKRPSLLF